MPCKSAGETAGNVTQQQASRTNVMNWKCSALHPLHTSSTLAPPPKLYVSLYLHKYKHALASFTALPVTAYCNNKPVLNGGEVHSVYQC